MEKMDKNEEMKYAELYSKWYSWGSPVGLSILLVGFAIALVLVGFFILLLSETRKVGVEIDEKETQIELMKKDLP